MNRTTLLQRFRLALTRPTTTQWENFVVRELKALRANGLRETLWQWLTIADPRVGTLVGQDEFGNRYYENQDEVHPRGRYWIPARRSWVAGSWDATAVPPKWHNWLSHKVDEAPNSSSSRITTPIYLAEWTENPSLTDAAYKPYSTTVPKLAAWDSRDSQRGKRSG